MMVEHRSALRVVLAVLSLLLGSPCSGGGIADADPIRDARFIQAMYLDLLGRPATAGNVADGLAQLNGGTRFQLALGIDTSVEYRTDLVQALYQAYLHRPPAPTRSAPGLLPWAVRGTNRCRR